MNLAQNGDQTNVSVLGSGPLNYHAIHLQNPDRIVLDFSGSSLKTSVRHIASNLDPVREIRLAQFTPEVSRVVIDLRHACRIQHQCGGKHGYRGIRAEAIERGGCGFGALGGNLEFDQDESQGPAASS